MTPETISFTLPTLNEGELYVGTLITPNKREHIILLPGELDEANWHDSKAWAASIGGDLPSRPEQALMFANLRENFNPRWYWSNEQDASDSDYAWGTHFNDGSQTSNYVTAQLRARAVRRLPI